MSRIKLNTLDPSFKHRVARQPGGEAIRACFACKACSAACPISVVDKRYDPRKIIRMALLGMKKGGAGERFHLALLQLLRLPRSMPPKCPLH